MKNVSPKNSVQIIGNLGADPEMKTFPATNKGGKNGDDPNASGEGKLARLRVASNERYRNAAGEWTDRTEWHSVVCWDGVADQAERMLQKGSEVLITGRLHYNTYVGKDGATRTSAEIEAATLIVLDKARQRTESGTNAFAGA